MKRGLIRSSRYSPGNMARESLEVLFIGRQSIMSDVVDKIVVSVRKKNEKHFVLLVGPRGSGKTHFVSLAYYRIREAVEAAGAQNNLVVAYLNEEEWGVASYLDFLVRILRALDSGTSDLGPGISSIYEKFSSSQSEAEVLAETLISKHVGTRTLLLICENLVDLFEGLGDEGQKRWRAFIQQTRYWSILATTPVLFAALTLQDHPFFGFFTLRVLQRIDFETACQLLVRKALHDGELELGQFLNSPVGRARVRAIHHLAAGNHRAYVVLYDFLDKQSLDDLIDPFMHMVDDLTPYYQDKMRRLAPAQRKIAEFLCHRASPATVKEIASQCLMSQQTAAKQIGELASIGFLNKIPMGRQTFCELTEPLMRICIEVKDNRTEHFGLFVEFLRHWFSAKEIEHRMSVLDGSGHAAVLDRLHLREALRCIRRDAKEPFVSALRIEARRCYENRDYRGLAAIREEIKLKGDTERPIGLHWYIHSLREAGKYAEALSAATEALAELTDDDELHFQVAEILWAQEKYGEALTHLNEAISINSRVMLYRCFQISVLSKLERYEDVVERAKDSLLIDPKHWHSYDQMLEALVELRRTKEAERVAEDLIARVPDEAEAIVSASRYFYSQRAYKRSIDLLNRAIAIDGKNTGARYCRGLAHFSLRQYRAAKEDLKFVVSVDTKSVGAYCRLSDTLMRLKEYAGSADAAERLLKLDSEHTHAYVVLGRALMKMGKVGPGAEVFQALLIRTDISALISAAETATEMKLLGLAHTLIERAAELDSNDPEVREGRALLYVESGDFKSAWAEAKRSGTDACFAKILQAETEKGLLVDALSSLWDTIDRTKLPEKRSEVVYLISRAMSTSVRNFGPLQLPETFKWLRGTVAEFNAKGVLGEILTSLLTNIVGELKGSREEWEKTIGVLTELLSDSKECSIPLAMLTAAVGFTFTSDQQYLLKLPLEQRQLLEGVLSEAHGGSKPSRRPRKLELQ